MVASSAHAQSFDFKTGQWDFTRSGLTMPASEAAKLPPQVLAELSKPINYKSCLTAQDLKGRNIGER